jgi:hypothetical protein
MKTALKLHPPLRVTDLSFTLNVALPGEDLQAAAVQENL